MTAEQRRQSLDFGKIRGTGMPIPVGASSASWRAHVLNVYYESMVSPAVIYYWRNRNLVGSSWDSKSSPSSSWASKTSPSSSWQKKTTPQDGNTQTI